jgi:hypothetical protein
MRRFCAVELGVLLATALKAAYWYAMRSKLLLWILNVDVLYQYQCIP